MRFASRPAAILAPTLLVLLGAFLPGCGNGDAEDALLLTVGCPAVDGTVPPGLKAVHLAPDGAIRGVYDLVPLEGAGSGTHRVVDGPDGTYRIDGPPGWWMLQTRTTYTVLRRGAVPPEISMGQAYGLYLVAANARLRPGRIWGAEQILPDGTRKTVPVKVESDDDGYISVLRFAKEDWTHALKVVGHLDVGAPGLSDPLAPPGPLADPIQFTPSATGRAMVTQVRQAPHSALDVVLVGASDAVELEGRAVVVEVGDLPIDVTLRAVARGGLAHFPVVAALGRGLRVRVPDADLQVDYDEGTWKRGANLRLLVTGSLPVRDVRTALPPGIVVDQVIVRPKTAVAYARVPFERGDAPAGIRFRAPYGPFTALLRAGEAWAEIAGEGDGDLELRAPTFEPGVAVEGRVDGDITGAVVRFFRMLGDEAVLGEGFSLRVSTTAAYRGHLPTGTYLVETASPRGERRHDSPLEALDPGASIHLPLTAP